MHHEFALMISMAVKHLTENTLAVSPQNQKYLSVEDVSPYGINLYGFAQKTRVEKSHSGKESWKAHSGEKGWGK